jgi:DNA-binding response OmpR family regulator
MSKRILFVDGDETIVRTVNTMLEEQGYQVQMETSGSAGYDAFSRAPMAFDLVITDLGMWDISGLRLAEKLLRVRSDVPIVLLTGMDGKAMSRERASGIRWFGIKPLSVKDLAETIENALGGIEPIEVV